MKTLFFYSILAISLFGCATSTMVMKQTNGGGGTVKYLNEGAAFVVNSRREHAINQIENTCENDYEIVAEGDNPEGQIMMQSNYKYIQFKCVK